VNKLWLPIAAVAAILLYQQWDSARYAPDVAESRGQDLGPAGTDPIGEAYANRESGVQVSGEGTVSRILDDDEDGGRHQRFILRLDSGQTLLIAHNIDLAPRIDSLQVGDAVAFNGVYEWNDRGGVIHWTHHDPQGQHEAGWLQHRSRTYQ
jgi:hypothetical protein